MVQRQLAFHNTSTRRNISVDDLGNIVGIVPLSLIYLNPRDISRDSGFLVRYIHQAILITAVLAAGSGIGISKGPFMLVKSSPKSHTATARLSFELL